MPVIRDPDLPQINAGQALYGAIPIELLPNGTAAGQVLYWDGVQWRLATLQPGIGVDISFNSSTSVLTIGNADHVVYSGITANAILFKVPSGTFLANSILQKEAQFTFTADAVLT